jgi:hypothetical protein
MDKIKQFATPILITLGTLATTLFAKAAAFSTSSLGVAIDDVSALTYDYFLVLIAKFWPFLLGAIILVGILVFGKRIVHSMWGR